MLLHKKWSATSNLVKSLEKSCFWRKIFFEYTPFPFIVTHAQLCFSSWWCTDLLVEYRKEERSRALLAAIKGRAKERELSFASWTSIGKVLVGVQKKQWKKIFLIGKKDTSLILFFTWKKGLLKYLFFTTFLGNVKNGKILSLRIRFYMAQKDVKLKKNNKHFLQSYIHDLDHTFLLLILGKN